jgi:hypothetical protein
MVRSTDKEYKNAKLIKQGKEKIDIKFKELADWISTKYKVTVLNINHKLIDNNRIRIGIAVETYEDYLKFKENKELCWSNYDEKIQNEIARKYIELNDNNIKMQSDKKLIGLNTIKEKLKLKDIFVATSAFEPIAREEVNLQITEQRIEKLVNDFKTDEIWKITRFFSSATLFVFTDKQKEEFKNSDIFKKIENSYFDLLKEYDEFNYWKREKFTLGIDTKQFFDEKCESNWFYYYK